MSIRSAGYMPQLDALRTFAVMLVIIYHWFPAGEGVNRLPNGTIGVVIFFVLSGFLITRILLYSREQLLQDNRPVRTIYGNFVVRRILRLFPLYFLVITFVLIALPGASDIDEHPLYYYLYGYNFLLDHTRNWGDILSPFWTLAVEEQLYLIWPFVVLLVPKKRFPWIILGMSVSGILFRLYGYWQGNTDGVLTPASLDTFGAGALWAYVYVNHADSLTSFLKKLSTAASLSFVAFAGLFLLPADHLLMVLFQRSLISVMALFIIVKASLGVRGLTGKILDNPALQYVGRISYGMYVFHMLIPAYLVGLIVDTAHHFHLDVTLGYWSHRIVSLILLLALSSLSWYAFEKPILGLKQHFSLKRAGQLVS